MNYELCDSILAGEVEGASLTLLEHALQPP